MRAIKNLKVQMLSGALTSATAIPQNSIKAIVRNEPREKYLDLLNGLVLYFFFFFLKESVLIYLQVLFCSCLFGSVFVFVFFRGGGGTFVVVVVFIKRSNLCFTHYINLCCRSIVWQI